MTLKEQTEGSGALVSEVSFMVPIKNLNIVANFLWTKKKIRTPPSYFLEFSLYVE